MDRSGPTDAPVLVEDNFPIFAGSSPSAPSSARVRIKSARQNSPGAAEEKSFQGISTALSGYGGSYTSQSRSFYSDEACDLVLPDSVEVQEQVNKGGSSITFLLVALGVIARLTQEPFAVKYLDELRFVRDCLSAGQDKTLMSCEIVGERSSTARAVRETVTGNRHGRDSPLGAASLSPAFYAACSLNIGTMSSRDTLSINKQLSSRSSDWQPPGQSDTSMQAKGAPFLGPPVPYWPVSTLSAETESKLLQLVQEGFNTWNINVFTLSELTGGRPLLFSGWRALSSSGCFSQFHVEPAKVRTFLSRAEPLYATERRVPYHNNVHAADVTQTAHAMLVSLGLGAYLRPLDRFSIIFSAVIHDIGHDGRNNGFHINVQDKYALTYNDRSVMENFHLATAYKLINSSEETNLLDGLSKEFYSMLRSETIEMVLATDMAAHFVKVGTFRDCVNRLETDHESWQDDGHALSAFRCIVLHAADISNPTKQFTLAFNWAGRCLREFFAQGDAEEELGFPVSPLCDRASTDIAGSQVGFIKFIVQPTYEALGELIPSIYEVCLKELVNNKKAWEEAGPNSPINLLVD